MNRMQVLGHNPANSQVISGLGGSDFSGFGLARDNAKLVKIGEDDSINLSGLFRSFTTDRIRTSRCFKDPYCYNHRDRDLDNLLPEFQEEHSSAPYFVYDFRGFSLREITETVLCLEKGMDLFTLSKFLIAGGHTSVLPDIEEMDGRQNLGLATNNSPQRTNLYFVKCADQQVSVALTIPDSGKRDVFLFPLDHDRPMCDRSNLFVRNPKLFLPQSFFTRSLRTSSIEFS